VNLDIRNSRKWKTLEMKYIEIVGVRFHRLHYHAYKTLKLFSIKLLMSTHKSTQILIP